MSDRPTNTVAEEGILELSKKLRDAFEKYIAEPGNEEFATAFDSLWAQAETRGYTVIVVAHTDTKKLQIAVIRTDNKPTKH